MVTVFAPLLMVCSGAKGLLARRTNSHEDMAFVPLQCSLQRLIASVGHSRVRPKLSERARPKICNSVLCRSLGPRNDAGAVMPDPTAATPPMLQRERRSP